MACPAPVPLIALLTEVDDARPPQARHHALEANLPIATLAVICGTDYGTKVEFFSHRKQARLETFLELLHGIPPHHTSGLVFGRLDPVQLAA